MYDNLLGLVPALVVPHTERYLASIESSEASFETSQAIRIAFELTLKVLLQYIHVHTECCPVTFLNVAFQYAINYSEIHEF